MSDNSSGLSQLNGDQKNIYAPDGDLISHFSFSKRKITSRSDRTLSS